MTLADQSGSRPAVVRLLQRRPDPNNLMGAFAIASTMWLFAGFGVLWLRTGSGTVGERGSFTLIGDAVWIGPLFVLTLAYMLGPRRWFRRLWEDPVRLVIEDRGITWILGNGKSGFGSWDDVGGISSGADWRGPWRSLRGRGGEELVALRGPFADEATKRPVALPKLLPWLRPDLFEPLDGRHPERACVRRSPS